MPSYYKIPNNVSVPDLINEVYGTLDYSVKFLQDNAFIASYTQDIKLLSGKYVSYDETLVQKTPSNLYTPVKDETDVGYYRVKLGQSISDVCLQIYGNLDNLQKLIADNNISTYVVSPDTIGNIIVKFTPSLITNPSVFSNNNNKNIIYNTGTPHLPKYLLQEDSNYFDLEDGTGKIELE